MTEKQIGQSFFRCCKFTKEENQLLSKYSFSYELIPSLKDNLFSILLKVSTNNSIFLRVSEQHEILDTFKKLNPLEIDKRILVFTFSFKASE